MIKGRKYELKVGLLPCKQFKNLKGHLAVTLNNRPYKFCRLCTLMMVAEQRSLRKHSNNAHKDELHGFLAFDE